MEWGDIVGLIYNGDSDSGIAAYHTACWHGSDGTPEVSDNDPDQGWGEYKHPIKFGEFRHAKGERRITWVAPVEPELGLKFRARKPKG